MKQNKQDRRSQRTYQLVSAALLALMLEKRYDAITVQDILDRANIGRSTFYTHYFDKEDVLVSMIERMIDALSRQIQEGEAGHDILPGLGLFRHTQEQYQLYQALVRGHPMRGQGEEVLWKTIRTRLSSRIEHSLASAHARKHSPSVPLSVMSQYLAGAFLNLLEWWLEAEMPYSPEQMYEIFKQLALPGVWATIGEE